MTPQHAIALWEMLCTSPKSFAKTIPMFIGVRWLRQTPNIETLYNPEHYQAARMAVEFLKVWAAQLESGLLAQEAYHREHDKRWNDNEPESESDVKSGRRSKSKTAGTIDGL